MTRNLHLRLTKDGKQALAAALEANVGVTFSRCRLGSGDYDLTDEILSEAGFRLRDERGFYPIADTSVDGRMIHLSVVIDGDGEFPIHEVAIEVTTHDGREVLLCADASRQSLGTKAAGMEILFGMDLWIEEIPEGTIAVAGVGERLNLSFAKYYADLIDRFERSQIHLDRVIRSLEGYETRFKAQEDTIKKLARTVAELERRYP